MWENQSFFYSYGLFFDFYLKISLPKCHFYIPATYLYIPTSYLCLPTTYLYLPTSCLCLPASYLYLPNRGLCVPTTYLSFIMSHLSVALNSFHLIIVGLENKKCF